MLLNKSFYDLYLNKGLMNVVWTNSPGKFLKVGSEGLGINTEELQNIWPGETPGRTIRFCIKGSTEGLE